YKRAFLSTIFTVQNQIDSKCYGGCQWQKRDGAENLETRLDHDHRADEADANGTESSPAYFFLQENCRKQRQNKRFGKEDSHRICQRHILDCCKKAEPAKPHQ